MSTPALAVQTISYRQLCTLAFLVVASAFLIASRCVSRPHDRVVLGAAGLTWAFIGLIGTLL